MEPSRPGSGRSLSPLRRANAPAGSRFASQVPVHRPVIEQLVTLSSVPLEEMHTFVESQPPPPRRVPGFMAPRRPSCPPDITLIVRSVLVRCLLSRRCWFVCSRARVFSGFSTVTGTGLSAESVDGWTEVTGTGPHS